MLPASPILRGYASIALAGVAWGGWILFLRRAPAIPPPAQSLLALLVMGVAGLPWVVGRLRVRRPRWAWGLLALVGLSDAANFALFFGALARGSTSVAVLTHYLAPVGVALLAPRLLDEPLGRRTPAAVGVAFLGLAILLWGGQAQATADWTAAFMGAGSALFFALNVVAGRVLLRHFTGMEVMVWHALVAALALWPLAPAGSFAVPPAQLGWLAAGALFCGLFAGAIYFNGLARVPAARAGVLMYLEPLTAVLIAWAAFGEAPAPAAALGGACIVAAGALVVTEDPPTPNLAVPLERGG